ncbi:MAG: hypothetical protein CM1200mP37_0140 [Chloroflexota bacterium]|nr:MAG: hypothetical protein CM1200mP37_0140 [Chloroflexota bacterium]
MATMDIVNETGFQPANFLDVGGGADQQKIVDSLRIILEKKTYPGYIDKHIRWSFKM